MIQLNDGAMHQILIKGKSIHIQAELIVRHKDPEMQFLHIILYIQKTNEKAVQFI
jgi:hypothetical protein